MKQVYLYRLFRYSKVGFSFLMLFILIYAITFYKKMDMIFFPYNAMYAVDFQHSNKASTYAMKLNGNLVKITRHLYWKKDFLETSLHAYAQYLQKDRRVFLDDYLTYKFKNDHVRSVLSNGLTPNREDAIQWPSWFIKTAGYDPIHGSILEILRYDFLLDHQKAILYDSARIYKSILP